METVKIVFWSQGGNTAAMAAAVAEGVQEPAARQRSSMSVMHPQPICRA